MLPLGELSGPEAASSLQSYDKNRHLSFHDPGSE